MRRSTDKILTSHAGSLPRPDALIAAWAANDETALADDTPRRGCRCRATSKGARHRRSRRWRVRQADGSARQLRFVVALFMAAPLRHRAGRAVALRDGGAPLASRRDRPDQLWRPPRPNIVRGRLQRPGIRHHDRAAPAEPGVHRSAPLYRARHDQGRYRPLQSGAGGGRGRRRLYDRGGARQLRAHRQRALQDRRGVPLRLRRRDARGVQGDRRCRHHPAARRSVHRRRVGPGQSRAELSRTTESSRHAGSRRSITHCAAYPRIASAFICAGAAGTGRM